ncbi:sensor histidine kinase [Roseofilum casamattae]|uniref:histidine kinase n=1 Tax=Roseofilum casamattae BLCC-M143 TaxID=3022442 RepID=A0ABT7C1K3_9CYAN|nr:ATP-binding protein [Roseofilum casamattae]MDJ1185311.1 ATP-binding protein [Roseofilum casamattae BLCC-M143]
MLKSNLLQFPMRSLVNWSRDWTISKKIGYGYAIAIGIATLGAVMGLIVGEHYQRQAKEQLARAEKQKEYLIQVENLVLKIRYHQKKLLIVLDNPLWFNYETSEFDNNVNELKRVLENLAIFIEENPDSLAVPRERFLEFDREYANLVERYSVRVQSLWTIVNPLNVAADDRPLAQAELIEAMTGQKALHFRLGFERLAEKLLPIKIAANKQQKIAIAELVRANRLRWIIILSSLVGSGAIAAVSVWYASRAIAHPLEQVTDIARKVTAESNFNLRAPMTANDETAILAESLNQLIAWVGQYTEELEHALESLKQTQTQLIQTEKMSSLGQMVAGVAHEINNPMNFIRGNLSYLEQSLQDLLALIDIYAEHYPTPVAEVEEAIQNIDLDFVRSDMPAVMKSMQIGSKRVQDIVLSLRNFSRLDEAETKEVDLHEGLDSTLTILSNRLREEMTVVKHYGDLPLVYCYPAQLNQVFLNLIANSLDALAEVEVREQVITISTEVLPGDRVQVKISDNGSGIPDEIKDKLFDPFFTTKPIGQGTGLGLSVVYQIVETHQGTITVNSQVGVGSEFIVELPIHSPLSLGKKTSQS